MGAPLLSVSKAALHPQGRGKEPLHKKGLEAQGGDFPEDTDAQPHRTGEAEGLPWTPAAQRRRGPGVGARVLHTAGLRLLCVEGQLQDRLAAQRARQETRGPSQRRSRGPRTQGHRVPHRRALCAGGRLSAHGGALSTWPPPLGHSAALLGPAWQLGSSSPATRQGGHTCPDATAASFTGAPSCLQPGHSGRATPALHLSQSVAERASVHLACVAAHCRAPLTEPSSNHPLAVWETRQCQLRGPEGRWGH